MQMASPDKIGNRRGQDKWFSDAELERWAEAHRPVGVVVRPAQWLGVAEAAEEHAAQGEGEGSGDEVATPVDQGGGELPRAKARRNLQPPARARERSDEPEQRVVVDQRELGPVVADGRAAPRHGVVDVQHGAGAAVHEVVLPQRILGDVREMSADLYAGK